MTITATEFKTNLGKYLDQIAAGGEDIFITKNGKEYAKLSSPNPSPIFALNRLIGIARDVNVSYADIDMIKKERIEEKYGVHFD